MNSKSSEISLVAEVEGQVVGFILGDVSGWEFGVPETIGWMDTIGVDPAYQKRGIATVLARELIKNLKAIGVKTIYTLVGWDNWDLLQFFSCHGIHEGGYDQFRVEDLIPPARNFNRAGLDRLLTGSKSFPFHPFSMRSFRRIGEFSHLDFQFISRHQFLFRVEVVPAAEGTEVYSQLVGNAPQGIAFFNRIGHRLNRF